MKPKLYILTLEPIEQRYTKQWYNSWKKQFSKWFNVIYIDGKFMDSKIEKGKWLDINKTNIWKAQQVEQIGYLFMKGYIKDGDRFLFADGWHWGIIPLRYMSDLQNIKIKVYGYWHAGSYDDNDFLSQINKQWTLEVEDNFFNMYDYNFVATQYHKELIEEIFQGLNIQVVGFPINWEYEIKKLNIPKVKKENIIIFPHRLDKEKQPEVFYKLSKSKQLNKYTFITTINKNLSKRDYYMLLSKAKVCFSSSLQETFGIGTVEAVMLGCIPIVPDRLSYKELYNSDYRYTSNKDLLSIIIYYMNNFYNVDIQKQLKNQKQNLIKNGLQAIPKMANIMRQK